MKILNHVYTVGCNFYKNRLGLGLEINHRYNDDWGYYGYLITIHFAFWDFVFIATNEKVQHG